MSKIPDGYLMLTADTRSDDDTYLEYHHRHNQIMFMRKLLENFDFDPATMERQQLIRLVRQLEKLKKWDLDYPAVTMMILLIEITLRDVRFAKELWGMQEAVDWWLKTLTEGMRVRLKEYEEKFPC